LKSSILAAALGCAAALAIAPTSAQAQEFPIPETAAQVPGPPPGTAMTKAYVETVGRMAYLWGWALVNMANRAASASKAPEPMAVGGMPVGYGRLAALTDYMSPEERVIECPNQDVVYGVTFADLDKEPMVFQVPDFGDRFWVYALYDARTDEFSKIGKQYGTKPGFYLMAGPNWKGGTPAGITAVVRSSTALAFAAPRIFMDDTPEDRAAVQTVISQINFYPLSEFDGKMKITDWSKLPHAPAPWPADQKTELPNVFPETFFDQLPALMKQVPPMPGEEALYAWIASVSNAAAEDAAIMTTLKETAAAAERDIWTYMQWRYNGRPAGNGWNSPVNNAEWGSDYLNRTATARSNMFDNRPEETKYIYTDDDSAGRPLEGDNAYAITFAKGETPPVKGFWSLILYNEEHFFHANALGRYSLGTKNKTLKYNGDGSLTLYASAKSPGEEREARREDEPRIDGEDQKNDREQRKEKQQEYRHIERQLGAKGGDRGDRDREVEKDDIRLDVGDPDVVGIDCEQALKIFDCVGRHRSPSRCPVHRHTPVQASCASDE
jgi:hypothetical protein